MCRRSPRAITKSLIVFRHVLGFSRSVLVPRAYLCGGNSLKDPRESWSWTVAGDGRHSDKRDGRTTDGIQLLLGIHAVSVVHPTIHHDKFIRPHKRFMHTGEHWSTITSLSLPSVITFRHFAFGTFKFFSFTIRGSFRVSFTV